MMRFIAMIAAAAGLAAGVSAEFTVSIAPDQPIPHVYVDDVLVLEIASEHDVTARVQVAILEPAGTEDPVLDAEMPLRARGIRWIPLERAALRRGRYVARVTIEANEKTTESMHPFCRIDRPVPILAPPVGATIDAPEPYAMLAMRDLPLYTVCFAADNPELGTLIDTAVQSGLRPVIVVDLAATSPDTLAGLLESYGSRIAHWTVRSGGAADVQELAAALFAEHEPAVAVSWAAATPEELGALLHASAGQPVSAVVFQHNEPAAEDLAAFELAAQTAGYEGLPLHILGRGIEEDGPDAAARLARNLITFAAKGAAEVNIDSALLFRDHEVTEAYVFVSALVRCLAGAVPIGMLDAPAPYRAVVFRQGDSWLLAAWSEGKEGSLSIPIGDAVLHELADASNNPLELPVVAEEAVSLALSAAPVYLRGEGGTVLASTARRMMQNAAADFAANPAYAALLPEQVAEIFAIMKKAEPPRIERSQFLALLPMFPLLEAQWHSGKVPQEIAVPAMSALSDIIRQAAVIEQGFDEPFVQPLQDTLATCAEFQQDFLTRAEAPPETRTRADWLLAEVTRLAEEAKDLNEANRATEANAIASLAKWRAHALNATLNYAAPTEEDAAESDSGES